MFRKKYFLCFSLFFIFAFNIPVQSFKPVHTIVEKDFFVLTLPKSGTHLLLKLLLSLSSKKRSAIIEVTNDNAYKRPIAPQTLEQAFLKWKQSHYFCLDHLEYTDPLQIFHASHPEYIAIIQVRDLRDVFISLIDWKWDIIEKQLPNTTLSQKLMYAINDELEHRATYINRHIDGLSKWLNGHSNVLIVKFEDLVGPKGGGSPQRQKDAVSRLAIALAIPLTQERVDDIVENLWGVENVYPYLAATFNQGKIERWKEYFNEEHKKIFKEKYGNLLIQLGYEKDNNW